MEKMILKAKIREEVGKTKVKKIRGEGFVPAVCYKEGKETVNIKVSKTDIFHALHTKAGENVLITLDIEDKGEKKSKTVMVKEVQREPINSEIIHVDFSEISLTKTIKVKVPVVTHGDAKKVASEGGIVEHIVWEVEVECLPMDIPEKIQVEISELKIGDIIHLKDLKVKEGIKLHGDADMAVILAKMPAKEEVAEAVPGSETEEPEVIAKGKKPEEGEEEAGKDAPQAPAKEEKKKE